MFTFSSKASSHMLEMSIVERPLPLALLLLLFPSTTWLLGGDSRVEDVVDGPTVVAGASEKEDLGLLERGLCSGLSYPPPAAGKLELRDMIVLGRSTAICIADSNLDNLGEKNDGSSSRIALAAASASKDAASPLPPTGDCFMR